MWIGGLLACWHCFEAIGTIWAFCPWCGVSLAYDRDENESQVPIDERYAQYEINEACTLTHCGIDTDCENADHTPHDPEWQRQEQMIFEGRDGC